VLLCIADSDADDEEAEDYYDTDAKLRLGGVSVTPDRKTLPQRYNDVKPSSSDSYVLRCTPKVGQSASSHSPVVCVLCIVLL